MTDADLEKMLSNHGPRQRFLAHGQTQGEVLEGVVLAVVEEPEAAALAQLVEAYDLEMGGFRQRALLRAKELAQICVSPEMRDAVGRTEASALMEGLPVEVEEPEMLTELDENAIWHFVSRQGEQRALFERLLEAYKGFVSLRAYVYKGLLQVQVNVRRDEIFYNWAIHMAGEALPPLFRGMVCTYAFSPRSKEIEGGGEVAAIARIVALGKLKFLNYMWRTYGVRNRLDALVDIKGNLRDGGKEAYLRRIRRGFLKVWQVPADLHDDLMRRFSRWADYVQTLTQGQRRRLLSSYLPFLEAMLEAGEACRFLSLGVVNLTGAPITASRSKELGIFGTTLDADTCGLHGSVSVLDKLVKPSKLKHFHLVLVLKNTAGPDPPMWKSMLQSYRSLIEAKQVVIQPLAKENWLHYAHSRLATVSQPVKPAEPQTRRTIIFVVILALPPGGGKSTFFRLLAAEGTKSNLPIRIVSSDACGLGKAGRRKFEIGIVEAANGNEPMTIIGYDKNVPNREAWEQVFSELVRRVVRRGGVDVKVVAVVPQRLQWEIMWQRIKSRPSSGQTLVISATLSENKVHSIARNFFNMCSKFLPFAQRIPGAIVSSAFMPPSSPADVHTLAAQIVQAAAAGSVGVDHIEAFTQAQAPSTR